jgi:hypothetical protein
MSEEQPSTAKASSLAFREFLVELLGVLLPGLFFTLLLALAIGIATTVILSAVPVNDAALRGALTQLRLAADTLRVEIVILLFAGSYVVGHFLYRQDPKLPDTLSYKTLARRFTDDDRDTWVVRPDPKGNAPTDIQFPYRYLHEYLDIRGLAHLAALVPWKGADDSTHKHRTKIFINLLKIRLHFHFPDRCGQILRNEAHVRLMSSVWYGGRLLMWASVLCVPLILFAAVLPTGLSFSSRSLQQIPALFAAVTLCGVGVWTKNIVERFLHYQRVREVVFVLETAFIAAQERPSLLENLS